MVLCGDGAGAPSEHPFVLLTAGIFWHVLFLCLFSLCQSQDNLYLYQSQLFHTVSLISLISLRGQYEVLALAGCTNRVVPEAVGRLASSPERTEAQARGWVFPLLCCLFASVMSFVISLKAVDFEMVNPGIFFKFCHQVKSSVLDMSMTWPCNTVGLK